MKKHVFHLSTVKVETKTLSSAILGSSPSSYPILGCSNAHVTFAVASPCKPVLRKLIKRESDYGNNGAIPYGYLQLPPQLTTSICLLENTINGIINKLYKKWKQKGKTFKMVET